MLNLLAVADLSNKTLQFILLIVLIVMIVLLAVLGIVFIVALRKRAPVIKVVMAPPAADSLPEPEEEDDPEEEQAATETVEEEPPIAEPVPEPAPEEEVKETDDDPEYVTEGKDSVRYDRSHTAKLIQLKDESKEWYGQIKNELLSYERVKSRISWKRETFRIGRSAVARLIVRGKTLCLLLAVEPSGFAGTKYAVEDVSASAATADTPSLYRIKGNRRAKYAKELIDAVMKELAVRKAPDFEPQDYYMAYEGTMGLMEKGLVKRVVTNSSRTFEIREVTEKGSATSADDNVAANTDTEA